MSTKRPRSSSAYVSTKKARTNPTVTAVVRKELRKATDWKYTDYQMSGGVSSTGTVVSLLSNMTRGDNGFNNFLGNTVKPQALTIKYFATTDQTHNNIRVMVIQWFDSVVPAVSGILQGNSLPGALICPTLITNKPYIKVLHDSNVCLAPSTGGSAISPVTTVYIPGKRLRQVRFNQNSNVCQDGNIYLLTISDDTLVSFPQLIFNCRVTFSDQ